MNLDVVRHGLTLDKRGKRHPVEMEQPCLFKRAIGLFWISRDVRFQQAVHVIRTRCHALETSHGYTSRAFHLRPVIISTSPEFSVCSFSVLKLLCNTTSPKLSIKLTLKVLKYFYQKCFSIRIQQMSQLALSASFEYLFNGSTTIINMLLFQCEDRL